MSVIFSVPFSASRRRVGQQGDLTGVLDGRGDVALVLHTVAGDPTRTDLAAVGDELAEQVGVLVVHVGHLVLAELANLLLGLANHCLGHCGALFPRPSASMSQSEPGSHRNGWLCLRMSSDFFGGGASRKEARRSRRRWPRGRSA